MFGIFFSPEVIIKSLKHHACAADLNSIEKTPRLCIGFEVPPSKCVACAQDLMSSSSVSWSALQQTPRLCSGFELPPSKCVACAQDLMSRSSVSWSALQQTPRLYSGIEGRLFFPAENHHTIDKTQRLCSGFEFSRENITPVHRI